MPRAAQRPIVRSTRSTPQAAKKETREQSSVSDAVSRPRHASTASSTRLHVAMSISPAHATTASGRLASISTSRSSVSVTAFDRFRRALTGQLLAPCDRQPYVHFVARQLAAPLRRRGGGPASRTSSANGVDEFKKQCHESDSEINKVVFGSLSGGRASIHKGERYEDCASLRGGQRLSFSKYAQDERAEARPRASAPYRSLVRQALQTHPRRAGARPGNLRTR